MLDFRTEKDKKDGTGYEIHCDTCGQVSLSSHANYCPYCTRDTVANFTAVRMQKKTKLAYVTFAIDARLVVKVPVEKDDAIEGILEKAENEYMSADLGELRDIISGKPVIIEDEDGNYIWEK